MKRCFSTLELHAETFDKKFVETMYIASKVKEGEKYDCVISYPLKKSANSK